MDNKKDEMENKNYKELVGKKDETAAQSESNSKEVSSNEKEVELSSHKSTDKTEKATNSKRTSLEEKQVGNKYRDDTQIEETSQLSTKLNFADELLTNIIEAYRGNDAIILREFARIRNSKENQSDKIQSMMKELLSFNSKYNGRRSEYTALLNDIIEYLQANRDLISKEESTNVRNPHFWPNEEISYAVGFIIVFIAEGVKFRTKASNNYVYEVQLFREKTPELLKLAKKEGFDVAIASNDFSYEMGNMIADYNKLPSEGSAGDIQGADINFQGVTEESKEAFQVTKCSELADQTNHIIAEYKKSNRVKASDGPANDIQVPVHSFQNVSQEKKTLQNTRSMKLEKVKCKKDYPTFQSHEEAALRKKCITEADSSYVDKTASLKKAKITSSDDFKGDPKEVIKLRSYKLEEDLKCYGSKQSELDLMADQRHLISSETKPITNTAKTEPREEVALIESLENNIDQAFATTKSNNELDEVIEKIEDIRLQFQLEYDGKKCISIGQKTCLFSAEANPTFYCGDVTIQFIGNRILVSTPKSEFDFYFRKLKPVSLSDQDTQT